MNIMYNKYTCACGKWHHTHFLIKLSFTSFFINIRIYDAIKLQSLCKLLSQINKLDQSSIFVYFSLWSFNRTGSILHLWKELEKKIKSNFDIMSWPECYCTPSQLFIHFLFNGFAG